jgi:hypothetical protein
LHIQKTKVEVIMKNIYKICLLLAYLCAVGKTEAQLLVQDFSTTLGAFNNSTITTGTYANSSPSNAQFTALASSGTGMNISVSGGTLNFVRTANSGAFVRNVAFSPLPLALHVQFDLNVTTTTSTTNVATMYFGVNQTNNNSTPANTDVHTRLAFNFVNANQFRLRDVAASTNGTNVYSGVQTVRLIINNSGGTLTYTAPNGAQATVANDSWDAWVGNTIEINEGAATTASVSLSQIKFLFAGASGTMNFDNLIVQPLDVQFRSKNTGNFNAHATWESSLDGTTWYNANFAPATSSNTVQIQSGHEVTVSSNQSIDQCTINSGGTLTVANGITLGINDETGTDLTVQGTLNTNTTGALGIAGEFTLASGATLKTANVNGFSAIGVSGIKTFTAGANYEFNGTALQTLNNPAGISASNFTVNNSAGIKLSNDLTVTTVLSLTSGDLDLNGKNITLDGILFEDRANNHLIIDNTATDESNKGGAILFSETITPATSEIRGTGLYLRSGGASYNVTVVRRHYNGAKASRGGYGIRRIYAITGTPDASTMRIYYASDETTGVFAPYELYRWTSSEGWKDGEASSAFDNGGTGSDGSGNYAQADNVTAFSTWTVGSQAQPLPITLIGFEGRRVEGLNGAMTEEVKLSWTTAQEINNKGFEVEMSEDGLAYQKIAFVEGLGNSLTSNIYQLTTIQPNDAYYRLRQVDFDGKFSYSPVVFVEGMVGKVVVYPNPNNGAFKVVCGTQTTADKLDSPARLLNAQGQEV